MYTRFIPAQALVPVLNVLHGQPVPDDFSTLMHNCVGSECTFCAWRRRTPLTWDGRGCWTITKVMVLLFVA